jgi:hypothetical protein
MLFFQHQLGRGVTTISAKVVILRLNFASQGQAHDAECG